MDSLSGNGEVCEDLRKKMGDVCCLLEVLLRGQHSRMLLAGGKEF